jgi:hypothetical protein
MLLRSGEDRGDMFLRNVSNHLQDNTASQPRIFKSTSSQRLSFFTKTIIVVDTEALNNVSFIRVAKFEQEQTPWKPLCGGIFSVLLRIAFDTIRKLWFQALERYGN